MSLPGCPFLLISRPLRLANEGAGDPYPFIVCRKQLRVSEADASVGRLARQQGYQHGTFESQGIARAGEQKSPIKSDRIHVTTQLELISSIQIHALGACVQGFFIGDSHKQAHIRLQTTQV